MNIVNGENPSDPNGSLDLPACLQSSLDKKSRPFEVLERDRCVADTSAGISVGTQVPRMQQGPLGSA